MSLLPFAKPRRSALRPGEASTADLLDGFSIEVMPRTAAKVEDFTALLPAGTRVYIAHIDGTAIEEMVGTARRLVSEGFEVMPHIPARVVGSHAELADWLARYQGEAGIDSFLVLGGGVTTPRGPFGSVMEMLETGLFDGARRLHIAGHPEGSKDIDGDGGDRIAMEALRQKQAFAAERGIDMAIATQFAFEAAPIVAWSRRLRAGGITLPVHLGIAGPAKLQTMIKFAVACGVGPSLRVLQRRAKDVTKLVMPFEPTTLVADLARARAADPDFAVERLHLFPLGGIEKTTSWAAEHGHRVERRSATGRG
ncbi:methylenetetrahydrofolate reductase [Tropicimonas sp. IMCC34011]|uniref:methylenetetrahydrofolate reductase n=1 Tax=Tropicimonas sp. IMCC34011 TaxID=2248759 RepID=UPI000E251E93|nr:methylenetetrahydrofolate reductase [Tropicimonas sp. IMCC34011]